MPCMDSWGPQVGHAQESQEAARVKASLCAILTALESNLVILPDVLKTVDWEAAGVPRKFLTDWWAKHKRVDQKRREQEHQAAVRRHLRSQALAKLSTAEREALGLSSKLS